MPNEKNLSIYQNYLSLVLLSLVLLSIRPSLSVGHLHSRVLKKISCLQSSSSDHFKCSLTVWVFNTTFTFGRILLSYHQLGRRTNDLVFLATRFWNIFNVFPLLCWSTCLFHRSGSCLYFGSKYESKVWHMDSSSPPMKISLRTCFSYSLWRHNALFNNLL